MVEGRAKSCQPFAASLIAGGMTRAEEKCERAGETPALQRQRQERDAHLPDIEHRDAKGAERWPLQMQRRRQMQDAALKASALHLSPEV